jgi:hypothetical protein
MALFPSLSFTNVRVPLLSFSLLQISPGYQVISFPAANNRLRLSASSPSFPLITMTVSPLAVNGRCRLRFPFPVCLPPRQPPDRTRQQPARPTRAARKTTTDAATAPCATSPDAPTCSRAVPEQPDGLTDQGRCPATPTPKLRVRSYALRNFNASISSPRSSPFKSSLNVISMV